MATEANNHASFFPTPVAGRPEPFHITISASEMRGRHSTASVRRGDIAVSPINGVPLPGKREPHK